MSMDHIAFISIRNVYINTHSKLPFTTNILQRIMVDH